MLRLNRCCRSPRLRWLAVRFKYERLRPVKTCPTWSVRRLWDKSILARRGRLLKTLFTKELPTWSLRLESKMSFLERSNMEIFEQVLMILRVLLTSTQSARLRLDNFSPLTFSLVLRQLEITLFLTGSIREQMKMF